MVDAPEHTTGILERPKIATQIEVLRGPCWKDDPTSLGHRGVVGSRPFGLRPWTERVAKLRETIFPDGLVRHFGDRRACTNAW